MIFEEKKKRKFIYILSDEIYFMFQFNFENRKQKKKETEKKNKMIEINQKLYTNIRIDYS